MLKIILSCTIKDAIIVYTILWPHILWNHILDALYRFIDLFNLLDYELWEIFSFFDLLTRLLICENWQSFL